jgi:Cd2+/Zn2+-exporting ATPase
MRVVWQNIALSLLVKFGIMALAVPGIANLWLAVFGDVGVLFLAVLNALRLSFFKREKN